MRAARPSRAADSPLRCRQPIHLDPVHRHLDLEGIQPSIGSVGDAFDNALMETIIGLFKADASAPPSSTPGPTRPSPISSTPPPAGSTGTTTAGSTDQSGWSHQSIRASPRRCPQARDAAHMRAARNPGRFTQQQYDHLQPDPPEPHEPQDQSEPAKHENQCQRHAFLRHVGNLTRG